MGEHPDETLRFEWPEASERVAVWAEDYRFEPATAGANAFVRRIAKTSA